MDGIPFAENRESGRRRASPSREGRARSHAELTPAVGDFDQGRPVPIEGLSDGELQGLAVENAAGRAEYMRCQKAIAIRAGPLRAALLGACELLLKVAGYQ